MQSVVIDVSVRDPVWRRVIPGSVTLSRRAAAATLMKIDYELEGELGIVLADDNFVQCLNRDFRGKDEATNVLAFPTAVCAGTWGKPSLFGDVVVAHETVVSEAFESSTSPNDHLAHLVVHGVLHLFGFDHKMDAEAENMERMEEVILATLGIKNPYEDSHGGNEQVVNGRHDRPI